MGKPTRGNARVSSYEYIVWRGEPGELKHLSTRRKRNDFPSSGERKGNSPNRAACRSGLEGSTETSQPQVERLWKGRPKTVIARYTDGARRGAVPEYHGAR